MNVAFIGGIGAGKTTAATYLRDQYGYTTMSFATPIKNTLIDVIHCTQQRSFEPPRNVERMTIEELDIEKRTNPVLRTLMQTIGHELGREFVGPKSIWCDYFVNHMPYDQDLVVDDCRYLNEYYTLKAHDFLFVRITSDEVHEVNHPSEQELRGIEIDWVIDSTIPNFSLETSIDNFMASEG